MRSIVLSLVLAAGAGLGMTATASAQNPPDPPTGIVSCAYVEAGAPGPADNYLSVVVQGFEAALFQRSGDRIIVTGADFTQPELPCGTPPTVTNVDRIVVQASAGSLGGIPFIDALLGGATPETDGSSEIEFQLAQSRALGTVWGTAGPDQIIAGLTAGGNVGMSIGAGEVVPDVDIEATGQRASLSGFGGPDVISTAGGGGLLAPLSTEANIYTGPGDDLVTGGPGREFVSDGPGRDSVDTGPGADALYSQRSGKDRLRCSGGRDRVAVSNPDRHRGCEKVVRKRTREFEFQFKIPLDPPFAAQTG